MSCERDCNQGRHCPARLTHGQLGCEGPAPNASASANGNGNGNGRIDTTQLKPVAFWFAPGVIDATGDGASRLGDAAPAQPAWRRWGQLAAAAVLLSLALGLASGWVVGLLQAGVL